MSARTPLIALFQLLTGIGVLLWASVAAAQVVTAEGWGDIDLGVDQARAKAIEMAVGRAVRQGGASVVSTSSARNGMLTEQRVKLIQSGQLQELEVTDEYRKGDWYIVKIRAFLSSMPDGCQMADSARYAKSLSIAPFIRRVPASANLGSLHQIDHQLPLELQRRLGSAFAVKPSLHKRLSAANSQPFSHWVANPEEVRQQAVESQVQFVLAGEVLDLSLIDPQAYQSVLSIKAIRNGWKRLWGGREEGVDDLRRLAFRVVLYDGLSGQSIFEQTYRDILPWGASGFRQVGFGTPQFWQSEYGRGFAQLLDQATNDIGKELSCQPFMIEAKPHHPGGKIFLSAGNDRGLKVGDTLQLVSQRQALFPVSGPQPLGDNRGFKSLNQLQPLATSIKVVQVYPAHAIAEPQHSVNRYGRYLAVVWPE